MKKMLQLIIPIIFLFPICGFSTDYSVEGNRETDTVYYRSDAKLEFIRGKCHDIVGNFSINEADLSDSISGILRVDLRTLRSGITTRDEHMRNRHLHTDKFPYAYFEFLTFKKMPESIKPDTTYTARPAGYFYIHGMKRALVARLEFSQSIDISGNKHLSVRVLFSIKLDDYKIDRPKALLFKLAEVIELEIIFEAHQSLSKSKLKLPNWPLGK